ncbi:MAG: PAS domain S-box protein [Bacteroidota bacterium]|nr:PAS domain S-box protein [Bacteroidota bacterium]
MPERADVSHEQIVQFQQLLDLSLDMICSIDAEGHFIWISAAAKTVWGYEPAELIGVPYIEHVVPEDRERTRLQAEAVMAGATVTHFENRHIRKDGSTVPIIWSAQWDPQSRIMYCVAKDGTEKEAAERKTRDFEQRLYRAYKLGQIGWWEWDSLEDKNVASDELYEIYGLDKTVHPVITTNLYLSLVHPEDLPKVLTAITNNQLKPQHQYEHRMIKPSGQVIHVLHYVETIKDENGTLVHIHGVTKDITDIKLSELTLRQSEQKLTTILESIGDCFFAMDKNWVVTYWNRRAEEVLHMKREDIIGKNIWEVYADATTLSFYSRYQDAIRENRSLHFEEYFAEVDMWVEISAYPSPEGMSIYFKDVTERKKYQDALKMSKQRYELASMATSDAIWDMDLQTNVIIWGEAFQKIFGHVIEHERTAIETWSNLLHPDDAERVLKSLQATLDSAENYWSDEYRFLKKDGSYAHVVDRGFVIRDEEGKAVRMVGAMQDVTQQKVAEQSVKLSEERFRLLFYQSPIPKWMVNGRSLQVVEVNESALRLYGYTKEEFLQLSLPDLILDAGQLGLENLSEQQLLHYNNIIRHRKKNGDVIWLEVTTHAIDLPTGRHFIVTGDDVTERIALQQMVLEEKFAAQKEVAKAIINTQENERSEIAKELHDNINQLLTTAKLYIENISYFPEQKETFVQKGVALLQKSINEIRGISKQLITPEINDIGFKATVDELLNHYAAMHLFQINVTYDFEEEQLEKDLQLTIYRIIQESFNNIIKYAKASVVRISITTCSKGVRVLINDNGVGFDKHKATKGVGLKNIRNRVEVFKGDLTIRTAPGKGTELQVTFPYAENEQS